MTEKVEVLNVNHPDNRGRVDAAKYKAMKAALLIDFAGTDGLTQTELRETVKPHLPQDLFPSGKTAVWWARTVQHDLEARGLMGRCTSNPLKSSLT